MISSNNRVAAGSFPAWTFRLARTGERDCRSLVLLLSSGEEPRGKAGDAGGRQDADEKRLHGQHSVRKVGENERGRPGGDSDSDRRSDPRRRGGRRGFKQ